jgi:hypothetical protein
MTDEAKGRDLFIVETAHPARPGCAIVATPAKDSKINVEIRDGNRWKDRLNALYEGLQQCQRGESV